MKPADLRKGNDSAGSRRRDRARHRPVFVQRQMCHVALTNVSVLQREFADPIVLPVENGRHELLTDSAVRETVVAFFHGLDVRGRTLATTAARFLSIEDARQPIRRPGQ